MSVEPETARVERNWVWWVLLPPRLVFVAIGLLITLALILLTIAATVITIWMVVGVVLTLLGV